MGELSIVIEDESDKINVWGFAHNPAGFLSHESVDFPGGIKKTGKVIYEKGKWL